MIIFLIGMSRAGKTETGKILAKKLKASFIDTDSFMEDLYGKTIRELYKAHGEKKFRVKELECFDKIIKNFSSCSNEKNAVLSGNENAVICDEKNAVVSTGGGYAENEILIKKLKDFPRIILIDTEPAEIFYRIKAAEHKEGFYPAFLGENIKDEKDAEDRFFAVYERRIKIYRELASFSINPKNLSPENTAEQIILSL
ncbi:shikimate kinase [Treponema sp. OMZ 792]|uniref:shikimate kinase n=1 Tax=unclassified Treponema TaxID=2638727 RepID=UPI0020A51ACB|nr:MULTISPECIES: shikimate kinase [unclassified Treponema]UTC74408.1 shikimate kinase [Treponema sp. OMZ 792]UTC80804.1 shikimate kinase [Treponema sp. OMZ 798]